MASAAAEGQVPLVSLLHGHSGKGRPVFHGYAAGRVPVLPVTGREALLLLPHSYTEGTVPVLPVTQEVESQRRPRLSRFLGRLWPRWVVL